MQWIQQSNTPCEQTTQVCGFSAGPQSNWLFTQLINRTVNGTHLPEVRVQIEFELRGCDTSLRCQRTFNTLIYETTSTDNAARRETTNYRQVTRVSPDVTTGARVTEVVLVDFETDEPSFYFAVQDETSCIVITRMIIFYSVCPSTTINLASAPETLAPPNGASPIPVTAACVSTALVEEGNSPKLVCSPGGLWSEIGTSGCRCVPGLGFMNGVCSGKYNHQLR